MNDTRTLYLGTYSRINLINHLVKNTNLFYRLWKYWHVLMLHGKALPVVVAWDMYCKVTEGKLDPDWKIDGPMDFYTFCDQSSQQMLTYQPSKWKYLGDELMQLSTRQSAENWDDARGGVRMS
jgi:hypothetical protein